MNFSSKLIEDTVGEFSRLPGVGKRTALRYVLYLLQKDISDVQKLSDLISRLKTELRQCEVCHNITEEKKCDICSSAKRDQSLVCVVEDIRDVMAIENTGQYKGLYHVLGGIISPMDGIGPSELNITSLVKRANSGVVKEIIMALSTTMEGDTTNFFIYKQLSGVDVGISTLARGVSIGDDLQYTDEVTLGRSILNRTPYEQSLRSKS